ncbi:MAG TPA: phosphatidate cytidylyltransferase [Candidatus Limnocylindrales bacterium]
MRQRLTSAAVLVPAVVIAYLAGPVVIWLAVAALAALAGFEAAELLRRAGWPAFRWLAALLATLAVLALPLLGLPPTGFGPFYNDRWLFIAPGIATLMIAPAMAAVLVRDPRQGFAAWLGTAFAALYAGLLAFAAALAAWGVPLGEASQIEQLLGSGRVWLLALVLTVWSLDSAAYVVGRYMPRGAFFNHISPNKTWSGAIGGSVVGIAVCSAVLVFGLGLDVIRAEIIGVAVVIAAQAGDLAESMLKRAAGAKDSGSLIPGHGGILDRVDSFLFAAPVVFGYLVIVAS